MASCLLFVKRTKTFLHMFNNFDYYTYDLLWKSWLVKSIQSIYNSVWSWHDKMQYMKFMLHLSSQDQCLPSFQGLSLCSVLKLLQTQTEAQNNWMPLKKNDKTIIEFSFRLNHAQSHPIITYYPSVKTMDRPWSFMVLPWLFTGLPNVQLGL